MNVAVATAEGLFFPGSDRSPELKGNDVRALARVGDVWWALLEGDTLARRGEGDWESIADASTARLNCVLPSDGKILVGASEARLMRFDGGLLEVDGFAAAPGRDEWFTPWGGPPDVRSLARDAHGVFVNVHVGGVLRSDDDGATWTPTIDIRTDVHQVYADDEVVLAAAGVGLAVSRDRGSSWDFDKANLHATYARAVVRSGDHILMSVSMGPRGGRAALYRRALDESGSFAKCGTGLPEWFEGNIDTGWLAASGESAAFASEDGDVYASEDSGASWEQIASGLPTPRWVVVS